MRQVPPLLVAVVALACRHAAPEAAPAEAPPPIAEPTELSARMQDHYALATSVLSAAIRGDEAAARARAAELAEMDTPAGLPVTWTAGFAAMRGHAATVAAAADHLALAQRAATLGRQCAACHQNLRPPEIAPAELAAAGWLAGVDEGAHAAATYQMWVGLFFPDAPTWEAGVAALDGAWDAPAPDLAAIAADAADAASPAARAEVFGRLVATCSDCHDANGVSLSLP